MPRIARAVALNYPHHVTQRGNNRQDVFLCDEDRRYYLELLKEYAVKYRYWVGICDQEKLEGHLRKKRNRGKYGMCPHISLFPLV
ncbi:MAG: hypothetical protein ABIF11_10180 [Nitrospirota bacterium]